MKSYKLKKYMRAFKGDLINLVLVSMLTGVFAGVVVTFYNILASMSEHKATEIYSLLIANPAFIPLLFLALFAGAMIIGTLVKFVPMIRGSGIPQIEGAARGIIRFKWYITMCSMFAASLACIFLGLSAGSEGPSIEIGGCAGEAGGVLLRRNSMVKRLQIAGGASAGLAVAFNAPVTGLVFAMEEAFRSFSPKVFICAAFSVVCALLTRNAIRPALGLDTGFAFQSFVFPSGFDYFACLWVIPSALVTALCGVAFYYAVSACKKMFGHIKFFKGIGKFSIPFVLAGAFGLITAYSIGGGHSFIQSLASGGTGNIEAERVFGTALIVSLLIIVIIRFISAVMLSGCGVPCGIFIPMLAVGAGIGAILSVAFESLGMNAELSDLLVIICMSVFFTTVVKAPVTGIVMVFELTGQFTNFVPALIGIAVGYLVGMLFRTQPLYEKTLAGFIEEERIYENYKKERVEVTVRENCMAEGLHVRSVIWPANGLIVLLTSPDGKVTVPDGETILRAGDRLLFECETDSRAELIDYLYSVIGKP